MHRTPCPPDADLQRLLLGDLPEAEVRAGEEHVLHCPLCLEKLKALSRTPDTLAGLLRQDASREGFASSPAVVALMKQLKSLLPSPARPQRQGAAMFLLTCTACRKKLSVKDNPAGKKIKCSACGHVFAVLAPVSAPVRGGGQGPFASTPEVSGQAPPSAASSNPPTHASSGALEATRDPEKTAGSHDRSLTDFLSPPQAADELGRLGKYRILKVLGHGGMGVVYQAEDPVLKRTVALKAMLPGMTASASAAQRFLREAQTLAAVEHDHIVRIHDVAEDRGVPFLAMEFLKGESLHARLARDVQLPIPEALRIGRELAEGLAAAHAAGLVHRDVKPANVWLEDRTSPLSPRGRGVGGEGPRVKILDFGLARSVEQESHLTQSGAILGTPAYMAPEQARGEVADARSDLFSLGGLLYRICCGKLAFHGKDSVSTLLAVAFEEPPPPIEVNPDVPPAVSELVMQLLQKRPERRPASASAVAETLRGLEAKVRQERESRDATVALDAAPPRGAAAAVNPGRRSRRRVLIGALVLVLGLLGVGSWAIIHIRIDQGTYAIETDDPDFTFQVARGSVVLHDRKTDKKHELKVVRQDQARGESELDVSEGNADLHFQTKNFTIKRGEKVALKAWLARKEADPNQAAPVLDDAWHKQVAALPPAKQVEAVAAKLKELNPGFDGRVELRKVEDGMVRAITFSGASDITPVRALAGLRELCYTGGPLSDLLPLKGLKLTYLAFWDTQVMDLTPLKGMPLTYLKCATTRVSDLSPLKGMPLTHLDCGHTQVSDLSPLKGMPLMYLVCTGTPVSDLSPLEGMPLKELGCNPTQDTKLLRSLTKLETINGKPAKQYWEELELAQGPFEEWLKKGPELSPVKQVWAVTGRLRQLNPGFDGQAELQKVEGGMVTAITIWGASDITPVRALAGLRELCCPEQPYNGPLFDLSPLKGLKLTYLACWKTKVIDLSPLKGMPLTYLECDFTRVADLSPLKGMPLTHLGCGGTRVADLSPLEGMPLTHLDCWETQVADLSPLKGMGLTYLRCDHTKVSDLSPLKGMPLKELLCDFEPERGDAEILRSIKTLEKINGKPAAEFWKEVEERKKP
jgi:serine/threonine protein kinase